MHRNRLSCAVDYNWSSYQLANHYVTYNNGALLAPGNRLSSNGRPFWALMFNIQFQWTSSDIWDRWGTDICIALFGIVGLVAVVVHVLKSDWPSFWYFAPVGSLYERYSWRCTKMLLFLSMAIVVVMTPLYASAANEFKCGAYWLDITMPHFSASPSIETALALILCAFFAIKTFMVVVTWCW